MRNLSISWILSLLILSGCVAAPSQPVSVVTAESAPAVRDRVEQSTSMASRPRVARAPGARPAKPVNRKKPARVRSVARTGKPAGCKVMHDAAEWRYVRGPCRNGYAHGEGEAESVDGQRSYRGGFVKGIFHGRGVYKWSDGTVYTGEFADGQKNGKGALVYPDQRRYSGQFRSDLYHGHGTYVDSDGSVYEGEFRAGQFEGRGSYRWSNGDRYTGGFRDNLMEGEGIYIKSNGERYNGSFANNVRSGKGVYNWLNGDRYTGEFRDNEINGEGEYAYADGSRYLGRFQDGKKHGPGRLITPSGEMRQNWEQGRKISEERTVAEAAVIAPSSGAAAKSIVTPKP